MLFHFREDFHIWTFKRIKETSLLDQQLYSPTQHSKHYCQNRTLKGPFTFSAFCPFFWNHNEHKTTEWSSKRPHITTSRMCVHFMPDRKFYFEGNNNLTVCVLTQDPGCVCGVVARQRTMALLSSRTTARSRSWQWATVPPRRARPSLWWAALTHRVNRTCASPCSRKVRSAFKKGSAAASGATWTLFRSDTLSIPLHGWHGRGKHAESC